MIPLEVVKKNATGTQYGKLWTNLEHNEYLVQWSLCWRTMAKLGRRRSNYKVLDKKYCKRPLLCGSVKKSQYFKDKTLKLAEKNPKNLWHSIFKHLVLQRVGVVLEWQRLVLSRDKNIDKVWFIWLAYKYAWPNLNWLK